MIREKLFALLVLGGISGFAMAQMPAFEEVDTNQDGMITEEEALVVEGLDFAVADTNGDGALDEAEFEAAMPASGSSNQ